MVKKVQKRKATLAEKLVGEMARDPDIKKKDDAKNVYRRLAGHLLTQRILSKMQGSGMQQAGNTRLIINAPDRSMDEALQKAEEKLGEALNQTHHKENKPEQEPGVDRIPLDDLDDADLATIEKLEKKGVRIIYPNLKYAKAKYENVQEVMKYIESDGSGDGIKIVIMNFND